MTRAQKKEWGDYLRAIGMAILFSLPAVAFVPHFFDRVPVIPKAVIWGATFGSAIYLAKNITGRVKHPSFPVTIVLHSVLILFAISLSFVVGFDILGAWNERLSPIDPKLISEIAYILSLPTLQISILSSFVSVMIFSGIYQISRKLGPGVLRNWMLGKYHVPREEERIFMFLDMKDSTTLAERLGAIRFSSLVRDFFADMTEPVIETRAEVSHYIGDEAVLTWTVKAGISEDNCVRLFFLFAARLEKRRPQYEARYGFVPGFKAGVHIGPVVATEVGELKSEIVYHGDVMNTAARIQSMCGQLGQDLLLSGELASRLTVPGYELVSEGRHLLKGKEHDVEIFSVRRPEGKEASDSRSSASVASPV